MLGITTLRDLINRGEREKVKEFFKTHHRAVPLCCFQTKLFIPTTGKRKSIMLYKCGSMKRYYTWKVFEKKCKECQEYMLGIISEYEIKEGKLE